LAQLHSRPDDSATASVSFATSIPAKKVVTQSEPASRVAMEALGLAPVPVFYGAAIAAARQECDRATGLQLRRSVGAHRN
jgi:hypothetical protein